MKILLLHTRLSGYLIACLRELKRQTDAEILIYAWPNQLEAPFDPVMFSNIGTVRNRYEASDEDIFAQILSFNPTVVLTSGWRDKGYIRICRRLKAKGFPIIAGCDTQWKGNVRQYVAGWLSPIYIQKIIDILWVTGERQRHFAQFLGYLGDRCWDGYYACDWDAFSSEKKVANEDEPYFLYVGRYAPEKGLDTLAAAYRIYCQQVDNPWPLVCAGAGTLRDALISSGAEDKGFIQPRDLPSLMSGAAAFVLPSRFEPWGVVVQEAAACGLPLIVSDVCGAGVHLVRSHHNGFSFSAGSVSELTQRLVSMHKTSKAQLKAYGKASYELSKQYTPQRWSKTLIEGIHRLKDKGIAAQ
ncbi:MAG: glycosyltransferase family 4 protein [Phormidesmis sp.]